MGRGRRNLESGSFAELRKRSSESRAAGIHRAGLEGRLSGGRRLEGAGKGEQGLAGHSWLPGLAQIGGFNPKM